MTARRTLDVSRLPMFDISLHAPLWWGQLMLGVIETTMLSILLACYYYTRLNLDMWPPPGVQIPPVWRANLCVFLLLVSCIGSYWASEAAKKDDRHGMILGLSLNLVLALAAMAVRIYDWNLLNFTWKSDIHGTYVWAFLGLHTYDVFADLIFTVVLIAILATGPHGPRQRQGVHVDSVIWYALVAIWIPIYITIYFAPRFAGAPPL